MLIAAYWRRTCLTKILSIPERIRLFKEINRVHRKIYGWNMIYDNAWNAHGHIDIARDLRFDLKECIPINKSKAGKYYFYDNKDMDITLLRGIFSWQAYYFYHLNPYKVLGRHNELPEEDFISDGLGKRIRPDVSHPVNCEVTLIEVLQRKGDGRIWISSNWLYDANCYSSGGGFRDDVFAALSEAAGGDEEASKELREKYEDADYANGYWFDKALERYFRGGRLKARCWDRGYLFAATREWRIKTLGQYEEALKAEKERFQGALEEFIGWLRRNGINLDGRAEEKLRQRASEFYAAYPCNIAREWCEMLIEEDRAEPSDVYLWWGGEPNSDRCYAFLTLFFEVDPNDIGTPKFDEVVSRNMRAIVNIAEKGHVYLISSREYEPHVWRSVFS